MEKQEYMHYQENILINGTCSQDMDIYKLLETNWKPLF